MCTSFGYTCDSFRVEVSNGEINIIKYDDLVTESVENKIRNIINSAKDLSYFEVEEHMMFVKQLNNLYTEL